MATLHEIMTQIEALRAEAAEIRRRELPGVIKEIQNIMDEYGISLADLEAKPKAKKQTLQLSGGDAKAKFRNPETGDTWGGRGRKPFWLAGQDEEKFRVQH